MCAFTYKRPEYRLRKWKQHDREKDYRSVKENGGEWKYIQRI